MRTADFDYDLPPELVAQTPTPLRDQSRLLLLQRASGCITHLPHFDSIIDCLRPDDLIVLNDSRVLPARLRGRKSTTGGEIEILLLTENAPHDWWVLLRPGKRVRRGTQVVFSKAGGPRDVSAVVLEKNAEGHCRLQFSEAVLPLIAEVGEMPLPPYISRQSERVDYERYQTVFARTPGSVAAPTAGLHFTQELLRRIEQRGVEVHYLTLHVGLGTFAPVKADRLQSHRMHEERFSLSAATARAINAARASGRRIVAVGTTTVRVLESVAADNRGTLVGTEGRTRIFIYPPFQFQIVQALLTNFHLPRSTLLMLVSAFAAPGELRGRELVLGAYAEAVRQGYRFFSYGDAMFIS